MKNLIVSLAAVLVFSSIGKTQDQLSGKYTLKIDISTLPDKPGKMFFSYYNVATRESFSDSIEIKDDNTIKMKGTLEEPVLMSLRYVSSLDPAKRKQKTGNASVFYIEPGELNVIVKDSLGGSEIKGSKTDLAYRDLTEQLKPFNAKQTVLFNEWSALSRKKDSAGLKLKEAEIDAISAEMIEKVYKPFYKENISKTPVAIRALRMIDADTEEEYNAVEDFIKLMPAKYQDLPSARTIAKGIEIGRKTSIGAIAMDFTQNDTLDHPVSLSSFRGKYVLIDFWASWCGPCRRENPNLVKSFNKYKERGFTVFSVSLDQPGKKDRWIKAIHDDNMTWSHVSDLKFWANAVAIQYNINSIPASLLIDPQGKILAKDLCGDALDKKLEEILNASKLSINTN